MLHISNQTLVEECRKGDKEALNLFYLRFAPRMLSVIHRYIRDDKDAEDVLHDGFIIALTRLDSLRDADRVEVWLATIMKNLSLQFLQAQDMATILHDIPEVEDTSEILDIIDIDTLESLIEKLPTGYQKVFRLAILENKSHKEIGKLLGIAPNSSSSQLFHAKLMMRKLIKEYRLQLCLGGLLALGLLSSLFFRNQYQPVLTDTDTLIANNTTTEIEDVTDTVPSLEEKVIPQAIAKTNMTQVTSESVKAEENPAVKEEQTVSTVDSIASTEIPPLVMEEDYYAYIDNDDLPENVKIKRKSLNGWSLNLCAASGVDLEFGFLDDALNSFDTPPADQPDDSDDKDNIKQVIRKAGGYKNYSSVNHTNSLPISLSLTASKSLNSTVSFETGVKYTYLRSTFETNTSRAQCHWHYLGIPLKLNLRLYTAHRFTIYAGAGGAVNIPLYSVAEVTTTASKPDLCPGRFSSPVVWSISGNLGMSLKLSRSVDVFIEPTLQYNFNQNYTVPNMWTDNNTVFSLPIGFRFNF